PALPRAPSLFPYTTLFRSRPKQGFAVPLDRWFRGRLEGFAHDLLLSDRSRQRGIFNLSYVDQLLTWQRRGRPLDLQLWTLISFRSEEHTSEIQSPDHIICL